MHKLSPGKWRGLQATSNQQNKFTVLAFDQRGSYRRMLPDNANYEQAVQIKDEVVVGLSSHVSAVLLDPVYGLRPAMSLQYPCGLLLALEKTGYRGESTNREVDFIDGWSVEKIKRVGGSAVKLLVYYHPNASELTDGLDQMVSEIVATCKQYDIPLFVEPLSYSLDANVSKDSPAFAEQRPELVIETARRLGALGVDVLKMEFPVDATYNQDKAEWRRTCETLSTATPVPWVLLSAGADFETYRQQVETACKSGASGFLAGRAIWKESIAMSSDKRRAFLATTGKERLNILNHLVNQYARPWTECYSPIAISEDWFTLYDSF